MSISTERIGLFGGTFAPPHLGHVHAAQTMSDMMNLDRLLIMPPAIPPHKVKTSIDTPEDRLEMCRAAFSGISGVEVSDYEIAKGGVSYTYDTLEYLAHPRREIYLLCGTDMFMTLSKWKNSDRIFRLANIVCVPRYSDGEDEIRHKAKEYEAVFSANITVIGSDPFEISSTEIRERIENGGDLSDLLPKKVIEIIEKKHLYTK